MRALRSLRGRLTLLVFLIALGAVGGVYLFVVPPLESRLISDQLDALRGQAARHGTAVARTVGSDLDAQRVAARVRLAAAASAVRVTLLRVGRAGGELRTSVVADSVVSSPDDLQFSTGLQAAATRRTATGTEAGTSGRWGEAARPYARAGRVVAVVVFSAPLSDVQGNVEVVRRQVLLAGAMAVALAALAGYLVARALSRRVLRLERAAEEVAAGDFSRPIPVDSDDELAQLTVAFNDMQRQLAQLDTARKRFIATASHELRTPIFSLSGFVELLEDEELPEEDRRRFVAQLREQVERLRKLAVDLLDLSKLEAGSLELRPEPVDLAELVRSVAAEFEPALARHDSHLELHLAARPAEVVCDPVRVAQVLRILLDNATTHTPRGTDIVVTTERANGTMSLAVRDGGDGIRRADRARVFEPFFTSDGVQGSGLGLAIASELAERMAGRLDVESHPGRTTFTLEVPTG
jgi:two-component system OmpR family sensor kinase